MDTGGQRPALIAVGATLLCVVVAMVLLWPDKAPQSLPDGGQQVSGTITALSTQGCEPTGLGGAMKAACGKADVKLTEGPQSGYSVSTTVPGGPGAPVVAVGDDVVLLYTPANPEELRYQVTDHERGLQLWVLLTALALAIVAFGRLRGVTALLGLGITFGVLLMFVIPAILSGRPPLLVAIVGAIGIALTVLYLTHGVTRSTTVAVAGTVASLTLTGVLAYASVEATRLSGVADETSANLGVLYGVNMQGLLLAGILIGSLGVLDDVTVTQAVTVQELAEANPSYGFRQLYAAATRVGRAHIASVINTIILAYAGASLPLLVLITAIDNPVGQVLSDQLVATELVRSAVGTIGLIAAVPLTTALAAWWGVRQPRAGAGAGGAGADHPADAAATTVTPDHAGAGVTLTALTARVRAQVEAKLASVRQ
ncbi:MAG TPA: YibE/F family protein [Pedococcus sp.]|uniref:YibE/F family protein n=1 Tax=Pedococcus sp. TaxID=2860345 RepID=UPI002F92FEF5